MAPQASRRHGYSRRAQYSVFTGYVIALLGALTGLILLGLSLWQPGSFTGFGNAARDFTSPVSNSAAVASSSTTNFFDQIRGYLRAGSENKALRHENDIARIRLAEAEAIKRENARLKGLLGLASAPDAPVAVTRFVGSSGSSVRRYGYIGAGSTDGVRRGMPVRSERGIVGRVLEVGAVTSRVLLLTDSESVVPVRLAGSNVSAFAKGRGDRLIAIKLINLGINPIKKGDVFVTSGAGGYYRAGISVAVAQKITTDGAIARMISEPSETNFVVVEPIAIPELVASSTLSPDEPLPGQTAAANAVSVDDVPAASSPSPVPTPRTRPAENGQSAPSPTPSPRSQPDRNRAAPTPSPSPRPQPERSRAASPPQTPNAQTRPASQPSTTPAPPRPRTNNGEAGPAPAGQP